MLRDQINLIANERLSHKTFSEPTRTKLEEINRGNLEQYGLTSNIRLIISQ